MNKNDVFTFTAPNGVKVQAVVLDRSIRIDCYNDVETKYLCYAQNRLFNYIEHYSFESMESTYDTTIIAEYAAIPEYDAMLEKYNNIEVAQAEDSI